MEDKKLEQEPSRTGKPEDSKGEKSVSELETLQNAYDECNDRYLRLAADFDNYKKRIAKETEQRIAYALEQFVIEILEVNDNLERALSSDEERLREGLEQIHKLLMNVFEHYGIAPIESVKKPFDPKEHEAICYVPSESEEGVVIDEIVRGYRMNSKVIRHSKVAVSRGSDKEDT
jgi:molecular chaperone GrpE